MSLGFEQAGVNVVAAFDSDPINVDTHSRNFPHCATRKADLSSASGEELRELAALGDLEIDIVFGGPPCQGFSEMGRRRPDDPRNQLICHFARLVSELKPSYFVLENVEGLLFEAAKQLRENCLRLLERSGYDFIVPPRLLDASDFGIPQKRERVFILGCRKALSRPRYPRADFSDLEAGNPPRVVVWDAIGDLPNIDRFGYLIESDLFVGELRQGTPYARILRGEVRDPEDRSLPRRPKTEGLSGCARIMHSPEVTRRFRETPQGASEKISRYYRLPKTGLARALRAGTPRSHGSYTAARPIHPIHPRCVSVREGARLQSFPDWFQFHPTKWHGFRQVGNAVPPLLARRVAREIAKVLASG